MDIWMDRSPRILQNFVPFSAAAQKRRGVVTQFPHQSSHLMAFLFFRFLLLIFLLFLLSVLQENLSSLLSVMEITPSYSVNNSHARVVRADSIPPYPPPPPPGIPPGKCSPGRRSFVQESGMSSIFAISAI